MENSLKPKHRYKIGEELSMKREESIDKIIQENAEIINKHEMGYTFEEKKLDEILNSICSELPDSLQQKFPEICKRIFTDHAQTDIVYFQNINYNIFEGYHMKITAENRKHLLFFTKRMINININIYPKIHFDMPHPDKN